jgi:hypothetical protein
MNKVFELGDDNVWFEGRQYRIAEIMGGRVLLKSGAGGYVKTTVQELGVQEHIKSLDMTTHGMFNQMFGGLHD